MRDYPRLVRASRVVVLVGRLLSFVKKSTDDVVGGGEAAAKKEREFCFISFSPHARALFSPSPKICASGLFFRALFSLKSNTA